MFARRIRDLLRMRGLPRKLLRRLNFSTVHVLVIDDCVPDPRIGAGIPRLVELLRALSAAGAKVTLFPTTESPIKQSDGVQLAASGANIVNDASRDLGRFLTETKGMFGAIIVSRPHNMARFRRLTEESPEIVERSIVIYDAEALFSSRDKLKHDIFGTPLSTEEARRQTDEETGLTQSTQLVLAVSEATAAEFSTAGHPDVRVLGYAKSACATPKSFEMRKGFLFVGPTYDDSSPNSDAVLWFIEHVMPRIRNALNGDASLTLVGATGSPKVQARVGADVTALGVVSDLTENYSRVRVFVAPVRYAAGIPLKVYDAAAYGVPAVVTPLLAGLIGWTHDREVLVADTPEAFAIACLRLHSDRDLWERIRSEALQRVANDCSISRFDQTVTRILADVTWHSRRLRDARDLRHPGTS